MAAAAATSCRFMSWLQDRRHLRRPLRAQYDTSSSCPKEEKKFVTKCMTAAAVAVPLPGEIRQRNWTAETGTAAAAAARKLILHAVGPMLKKRYQASTLMIILEQAVLGCQSFSLIAVAGSLIGSVLCFVEGVFVVLESFFEYFVAISRRVVDHGEILRLPIEAIDMFLLGGSMLGFGIGLYVMFLGSRKSATTTRIVKSSFGLFDSARLKERMRLNSTTEAKSKLGHAILLLLQAGMIENVKNVPLVTGIDLVCFAAAIFFSAASVFLLSKLHQPAAAASRPQQIVQ